MTDGIPVLTPVADWLEELLVRRFRREYTRVVRALTALSALLVVVSGALFLGDAAGLAAGAYGPIIEVTGLVVALFVLLGVVQFLLLARAVDRTAEAVTEAAETVETGAEAVESAAADVETAAKDVESVADEVESAAEGTDAPTPENAKETGAQAEETAERAQQQGEQARDVAREARERLGRPDGGSDEESDGAVEGGDADGSR